MLRSWSSVSMPWAPAMAVWKVSALARMAIAIREVCMPSFWCSSRAMVSSVPGASAHASRSLSAAWPIPFSRICMPWATRFSEREASSMQAARSSTPPSSQPVSGQRSGFPGSPEKMQNSSPVSSISVSRLCWLAVARSAGMRTASACSMLLPSASRVLPSRSRASSSTVRAGAYSVSTATGRPPG